MYLPMKLQSLNATRKNSNFIIRLNLFLLLYLFVSLSIVNELNRNYGIRKTV